MQRTKQILRVLAAVTLLLGGCVGFDKHEDFRAELGSLPDSVTQSGPRARAESRVMKSEPTALAAGVEGTVNQHPKPEASGYGSQESVLSSAQSVPHDTQSGVIAVMPLDRMESLRETERLNQEKKEYERSAEIARKTFERYLSSNESRQPIGESVKHELHVHAVTHQEAIDEKSKDKKTIDTPNDNLPIAPIPDAWDERLKLAIEALEERLKQQFADNKTITAERAKLETQLRLLYFIADDRNNALKPIDSFSGAERDYWKELVFSLMVYFDDKQTPIDMERRTLALHHFKGAADLLSTVSNLEVRNVRFCTRVDSYGRYSEIVSKEFAPGAEVLLYVEVDNFKSEQLTQDGEYETALLGSYEVYDVGGRRVDSRNFVVEKENCRNHRRDFFIPYRIYMPDAPPGPYNLQLTIKDVKSNRSGQSAPISFTIKR